MDVLYKTCHVLSSHPTTKISLTNQTHMDNERNLCDENNSIVEHLPQINMPKRANHDRLATFAFGLYQQRPHF